jgi:uncharacterized membrane protein YgcG
MAQDAATAAAAAPTAQVTAAAAATQGGTIHGSVVAGAPGKGDAVPLPGVAVTATNTLTGKKFTAATDIDGVYAMTIPKNGRYVVRAELTGFAVKTVEVVLNGDILAETGKVTDFGMELASRAEEAKASAKTASTGLTNGLQGLSLSGNDADTTQASASAGNTGVTMPTLSNLGDSVTGDAANAGADSITVSGQEAQMNGLANYSEDEIRQRITDAVDRAKASGMAPAGMDTDAIVGALGAMMGGAGPGGSGGSGHHGGGGGHSGGGGGSGAFRGFNPAQPHGGLMYQGEFASLDSAPWSPTLQPITNPSYIKNTFGASIMGSPYIPGLTKPSTKQFVFLNFSGKRDTTPEILTGTVPTTAERMGNFNGLTELVNGIAQPVAIFDPKTYNAATGTESQFAANQIDPTRITPQALYVLNNFYPACNIPGCETAATNQYNYQTITTAGQNSANLNARYVRNFGQDAGNPFASFKHSSSGAPPTLRQNLNSNFSYSHSASDLRNIFLILGGATISDGYNFGLGYTVGYGRFNNNASVTWNRSHAETRNYFTDTANDPSQAAGISRPDDHAISFRPNFYNGLPTLQFTQFSSLTNTNPSDTIGQTISYSDQMSWRKKHHNYRWGFDIRRVHQDSLGGSNPLGTIVFSGYSTESASDKATTGVPASGSAFADFLLGLPQQSKIQAGLNKIYLRENVFDAYGQDDYHVSDNVTLNYGVRYEYFAPYTEKDGHLVNLTGVATDTTSVGCVTPNGLPSTQLPNGSFLTCGAGPTGSLIHPDRTMWAPRFGVAWKPWGKAFKDTVLRTGYGINFNTSQFQTFAKLLSYQPPFAEVQNNTLTVNSANVTGCTPTTATSATNMPLSSAFGCSNKLYQNSFAVNPNYRLGMVQIYNADIQQTLPWGVVLNVGYNGSHGSDLDVVRAPNSAFSAVTTPDAVAFTYEDSIGESTFNALTVNARKRLQHGISVGATYQYAHSIDDASTFGGASSTSSIQNDADLHAERSNSSFDVRHKLTGNWLYELPVGPNRTFLNKGGFMAAALDGFSLSGDFTLASGTYYTPSYSSTTAEIAAGGDYTLRPNRVFSQPIQGNGMLKSFFNTQAFTAPLGYGSASRYSIEGPGTVVVDASLSRTVQLGDTRSFEGRMTASNVFNTVQYNGINTTVNSETFGQVTGAAAMRKIVFTARYRF